MIVYVYKNVDGEVYFSDQSKRDIIGQNGTYYRHSVWEVPYAYVSMLGNIQVPWAETIADSDLGTYRNLVEIWPDVPVGAKRIE